MFGLFKSKEKYISVNDQVWLTTEAKFRACQKMLKANPDTIFVVWFEATAQELKKNLSLDEESINVLMAEHLNREKVPGKLLIFVEHYPLIKKEQNLFVHMGLNNVPVLSALDEPFFSIFGGDRMRELMYKMGTQEDEVIAHNMISKSIVRAQEQIAKKVTVEKVSKSAKQWFELNGLVKND
ncbi:hypothetical protein SanaruYs_02700 [Chryseotalea sanaruensis]|uniref:Uncharacterized protein n=1 Tax=Chryseotalea sanaruensis TaxID=2482724 RepID=A0A401U5A7_9BACT|nr:hypothetical protein [Chryseotalea sanaruensis]GCC50055.1 hypothetical protein SanaruYs_02700 [Chryseotalea sanaruensis]